MMVLVASCSKPAYSPDEPLTPELRPAIYITSQNNVLYALNPGNGEKLWEVDFGVTNTILQEPVVLNGYALVRCNQGIVRLDADKGDLIDTVVEFNINNANRAVNGAISAMGDLCYTSTDGGYVIAFNYDTKDLAWTSQPNVAIATPGSFYNGLFIYSTGSGVRAVDQLDGNKLSWSYTAASTITNQTIAPPLMYVCGINGTLYAVSLEKGIDVWNYATGAALTTSPIAYGGNIIFGTDDNNLYCIDSVARAPRWIFKTDERVRGSAYANDQTIYFGSFDHYFYAVNIIDGSLKWRFRTGALIKSSPIYFDGRVYVGGYDKNLYAFDTTGRIDWKFSVNGLVDLSPVVYDLESTVYPAESGLSTQ